jgi:antitoxin (DNA-binding transcriptional repressor) of toxin-antitoxin stability system
MMEVFSVNEFQENFDNLIERVENGERIGIVNDDGSAAVMIPVDDNVYKMYTEDNNEAS